MNSFRTSSNMPLMNLLKPAQLSLAALLLLAASGCSPNQPASDPAGNSTPVAAEAMKTYTVKGVVLDVLPDGRTARIRHEEIPGYMEAMTMPIKVKDPADLNGVSPSDIIQFRLCVTELSAWMDQIQIIGREEKPAPIPRVRVVRNVEPLAVGDVLPDYPLTNQWAKPFRMADFKGRAVATTFIFTRCPFPDFCPRMSKGFADAQKILSANPQAPKNWHLLSLSFDPEFDTPSTLLEYGRRYKADFATWSFATGAIIEIDDITERFGVEFSRDETGINFNHRLRTVVTDTRGRIHHIFLGNEWSGQDLADKLVEAARVPSL